MHTPHAASGNQMNSMSGQAVPSILEETERWLTLLAQHTEDGVALLGPELQVRYASAAVAQILGYQSDVFRGQMAYPLVHPDDLAAAEQMTRTAIANPGRPSLIVNRLRRGDGEWRWIKSRVTSYLHDPQISGILVTYCDVTEQRAAELAFAENRQQLQQLNIAYAQSEERYRTFLQHSSEAIWRFELTEPLAIHTSVDEQIDHAYQYGYLAECNDAMAQMYGYTHAPEIVGAQLGDMLVRDNPHNEAFLRAFIDSGYNLHDYESVEVDCDGEQVYVLNNLIGIIEHGVVVRIWGTQRDITERKRLELERADLLERERAARLAAEAAVGVRDSFLSIAAHELRTPLTTLLGNAQLALRRARREDTAPTPMQQSLELIVSQSQRLSSLITALLDVSNLDAGRLQLSRAPVDLVGLARRATEEVQPLTISHLLTFEASDSTVIVFGDAVRLEQALHNLIQNAIKYSPGGGEVAVRVGLAGSEAYISVRDSGIGIAPEAVPHLFERFYRATPASSTVKGFGIGLYVVNQIVTLHGGSVSVESTEGHGSTFTIRMAVAPS